MPIIAYKCENGHTLKKFYRMAKDAPSETSCPTCDKITKKQLSAANFESKLIVDTGSMARQLEVNPDIIEINQERSKKNYREE